MSTHFEYLCFFDSFQFLAIIAFSLVAGFSVSTSVDFTCLSSGTYNYSLKISYPFKEIKQSEMGVTDDNVIIDTESMKSFEDRGVPRAAQYFVAWGVLTLFYCIIALAVYMLVTANEQWEKAFDFLVVMVSIIIANSLYCMCIRCSFGEVITDHMYSRN